MRLYPPWHWTLTLLPEDNDDCWVCLNGNLGPAARAWYSADDAVFHTDLNGASLAYPAWFTYKWRLVTP